MMTYGAFCRATALSAGALAFAALLGTASFPPAFAQSPINQGDTDQRPSTSPSQAGELPDDPGLVRDTSAGALEDLQRRNNANQNVAPAIRRTPPIEPQGGGRPALGDPPSPGNSTDTNPRPAPR